MERLIDDVGRAVLRERVGPKLDHTLRDDAAGGFCGCFCGAGRVEMRQEASVRLEKRADDQRGETEGGDEQRERLAALITAH